MSSLMASRRLTPNRSLLWVSAPTFRWSMNTLRALWSLVSSVDMRRVPRVVALVFALAAVVAASGCASDEQASSATSTPTVVADEDHDDEDHDDDEYDDEDHDDEDHDDEDHDDEEHDNEHDEDHDDEAAGLGAHEHGVAELTVAWSGGDMVVDLITPTFNIFGFEYEASTDEDIAVVAERTAALSAPGIISVNVEADCSLDGEVVTELEYEGSHAELTASWVFVCGDPDEIEQLETAPLFAAFANLEDIDAQWASDSGQSAAELSPSATSLRLN